MASIEERPGLKKTSYRAVWVHDKEKRSATFPTREAAQHYIGLLEAAGGDKDKADAALLAKSSTAPKLSEVAERYITSLIDCEPFTLKTYRQLVRDHYEPLDAPVDTITEDDVARWVAWMASEGKPKRSKRTGEVISRSGYSPKSIKNSHGFLFSIFRWAIRRGYRLDNPAAETRLPKKTATSERDKFLTIEEVQAILPHVDARYQPYVVLLFNTGLRAGELLALTPEDFTRAGGVTYVDISKAIKTGGDGKNAVLGLPKSDRSKRRIDVDDDTMTAVWPLIRGAGHGQQIFTCPKPGTSAALNKSMWKPAIRRAKAKGFTKSPTVHALRHSHASHLMALGMPVHEVSRRLGHASSAFTDKVYGHLVPARESAASKLLSGSGTRLALTAN